MIVGKKPKMVWGSKPYVNMTEHDRQERALGFPVRHNASQNKSLQNAFPIFECQMERRYKMQCTPFYYKNCCMGPFFLLEFSTKQGMVSSTCSPKPPTFTIIRVKLRFWLIHHQQPRVSFPGGGGIPMISGLNQWNIRNNLPFIIRNSWCLRYFKPCLRYSGILICSNFQDP